MFSKVAAFTSLSVVGFIVACGSPDGSEFGNGGGSGSGNGTGTGTGTGTGNGTTFGVIDDDGGTGTSGLDPKCASAVQDAKLTPLNLIFMYDKSGSMGDYSQSYNCGAAKPVYCQTVSVAGTPLYLCGTLNGSNNFEVACSKNGPNLSCKNSNTNVTCGTQTLSNGKLAVMCASIAGCSVADDFDPAKKWIPVGSAMKSFFTDAKSIGMSATLGFFPKYSGDTVVCDNTQYKSSVALTALGPSATAFGTQIDAQKTEGGTPSKPALEGALAEAETVRVAHPGDAVAVVLVTDGMPTSCDPTAGDADNVANVATVAQNGVKAAFPIATYVIGVQDATAGNLASLDQVAAAGSKDGKGKAFIVQVGNAAQTSADLQKALEAIRGSAISCDVALPPPPAGKTLDVNAVNVVAKIGGKDDTLPYSKDCATGTGWHYDNPSAPKQVQLCPASCTAIRADSGGQLSIAFGCATKGGVIL